MFNCNGKKSAVADSAIVEATVRLRAISNSLEHEPPKPFKYALTELYSQNVMAKIIRTAMEGLTANVSHLCKD